MTNRSERRAAEMAIIDAAYHWRKQRCNPAAGLTASAALRLDQALLAHEKLGLASPNGTPTNLDAPQTAHDAATWMRPRVKGVVAKVFLEIYSGYLIGMAGFTSDQVEQRLNMRHQSVSARINQLRDAGWVTDSGLNRKTTSGRYAIVWTPTTLALEAVPQIKEWRF